MMLRSLIVLLLFGCGWWSAAPAQAQGTARRHLITFTDKIGTPYTTSAPQQYLSSRSIQRRQRQGISVIERDLPPTPAYVAQVQAAGGALLYRTRWFNGVVVVCDSTVLARIRTLPFVRGARTLTRAAHPSPPPPTPVPADAAPLARPAAANYYGLALKQAQMIDAVTMHNFGYRGEGMHIALFDAGFPGINTLAAYRPLFQEGRLLSTVDYIDNDRTVFEKSGHGSAVMATIAANLPNTYVGIAPQASFHLFIVDDIPTEKPTEEVNWLLAAEHCDSAGVDIISSSLVYFAMTAPFPDYTKAQMNGRTTIASRAATMASATGMLVVSSAGNSGIAGAGTVRAPADADSVIAAGAVDSSGVRASFSSCGPTADGRLKPNLVTPGQQVAMIGSTGRVSFSHGTSFSCPIAAGLAAGFWQANPTLTAQQVRHYLQQSGSIATAPNNQYGYGIPNFRRAYDLANPTNPLPLPPTITGFSPASGPVGTRVTITGTNLSSVTAATIGTTALTGLVAAATQVQGTISADATSGPFSVVNRAGTATSTATFTVTPATPDLTFAPAAGSPGSVVLVTGAGFTPGTVVRFNGAAATGTVYNSPTQLTATVPAGASTGLVTASTGATVRRGAAFTVMTAPAPTIRLFSPTAAPVGSRVMLTGDQLSEVAAVYFGTQPAPGFSVVSSTSLTVPVPPSAGSARIYVLTPAGMAQTPSNFTLIRPPTLSSFSPGSGSPGAVAIIQGTHLAGATDVTFGGVAAINFVVDSPTRLTATVPAGAVSGPLAVTTVAGTTISSGSFTVTGPLPASLSGFSPAAGAVGMSVVITGTQFTGATQVRFHTTAATSFTINSATQITATVPAGALTGPLSVLTAGGMSQSATAFQVFPVPTLTSFFPATGSPGAVVVVTGTGLRGTTRGTIGDVVAPGFTVNSSTQLTVTIPGGATSGPVRVTTPGGTATSPAAFSVTTPSPPQLTSFSPARGPVGTSVTVSGTNFTGVTSVRFGSTPATTFSAASATSLTATVPAGATTGKLYVVNSGGMAQSPASFTVISPPTLTALLPDNGTRGSVVVLQGTNLTGATSVTFGGAAATSFTVNSARQLTAVVPNAAVSGAVTVTTVAGTASSPGAFTITVPPPPTVGSFTPTSGTTGTRVTITGTNFVNVRQVLFGLKPAESFVVTSSTSLTAQVPGNAVTGLVYVVAEGGLAASAEPFTVRVPPSIRGFTPGRGPVGTVVTLTGAGLSDVTQVRFGEVPATAFTVLSATQLAATVPGGAATAPVSASSSLGTGLSAGIFTVTAGRIDSAGLSRQALNPVVSAFPNPARGSVTVRLRYWPAQEARPAAADLYDALGRRVRTAALRPEALPTAELSLNGLTPGIYFVRVGGVTTRLLVE